MTSPLTPSELKTLYDAVRRAELALRGGVTELSDLFTEKPRLIISPSNFCVNACLHCVADSTPTGEMMSYDDFTKIDTDFIKIFSSADFGRRGNPLLYHSNGNDLVDLVQFLHSNGISKFTFALTLQPRPIPMLDKLNQFVNEHQVYVGTMVTYHHYHKDLDTYQLAQDFNSTLKNYWGFSNRITLSLLGDGFSQQEPTMAEEVRKAFKENWGVIFKDIELAHGAEHKKHVARYQSKEVEIRVPRIDTRVYPLGRFRDYLESKGVMPKYEQLFEPAMRDHVCPDLVKWPGIIIEPDGSLNLCASFEAVNCRGAVVSNIFTKPYAEVQEELLGFHQMELHWFIDNLSAIMEGKVSTCKLRNGCYKE